MFDYIPHIAGSLVAAAVLIPVLVFVAWFYWVLIRTAGKLAVEAARDLRRGWRWVRGVREGQGFPVIRRNGEDPRSSII